MGREEVRVAGDKGVHRGRTKELWGRGVSTIRGIRHWKTCTNEAPVVATDALAAAHDILQRDETSFRFFSLVMWMFWIMMREKNRS